jgi:hypothetical protein
MESVRRHLTHMYGMDPRSLVALRICMSVLVLVDCCGRVGPFNNFLELRAFYGPDGLWPQQFAQYTRGDPFMFHYTFDTIISYQLVFGATAISACCMLVGYNTSFATLVCWLLTATTQQRNTTINSSGDLHMRNMLLLMLFLPESTFSVDTGTFHSAQLHRLGRQRCQPVLSCATLAFSLQIGLMYMFSAFHKSYVSYVQNADAIKMSLQFEHFVSENAVSTFIRQLPDGAIQTVSRMVFFVELICGCACLFPLIMPQRVRTLCVLMLTCLQFGILSHMNLGIFPWICLTQHLACLPTLVWNGLLGVDEEKPIIERVSHRSVVSEVSVLLLLILMVLSNLHTMPPTGRDAFMTYPHAGNVLSEELLAMEKMLGTRQVWSMFNFCTTSNMITGRYILVGKLHSGVQLNLFTMKRWKRPRPKHMPYAKMYPSHRWMSYWKHMWDNNENPEHNNRAAKFLCHKYNDLGYTLTSNMDTNRSTRLLANVTIYRVAYFVDRFVQNQWNHPTNNTIEIPTILPTRHSPRVEHVITVDCV